MLASTSGWLARGYTASPLMCVTVQTIFRVEAIMQFGLRIRAAARVAYGKLLNDLNMKCRCRRGS